MRNLISLILVLTLSGLCYGQNSDYLDKMDLKQLTFAADRGMVQAQARLGSIYADGKGVDQDYVQAYKWLTLSIDGAVENTGLYRRSKTTVEARKAIADKLTPQQIEEADQQVKEWESNYEQRMKNVPYVAGWGVVTPKDVYRPSPNYTDRARQSRINGTIVVQFVVRKDGTVSDCKILRGLGYGLDESAIETITTRWRFQPGTFMGRPVDIQANAEVNFRLY